MVVELCKVKIITFYCLKTAERQLEAALERLSDAENRIGELNEVKSKNRTLQFTFDSEFRFLTSAKVNMIRPKKH